MADEQEKVDAIEEVDEVDTLEDGNKVNEEGSTEDSTEEGSEGKVTESTLKGRLAREKELHNKEIQDVSSSFETKLQEQKEYFELELKRALMTEEEREEFDSQREEVTVTEREVELERKLAELNKRELTWNVNEKLAERGLPDELTDLLVELQDDEAREAKIEALDKAIRDLVNSRVKGKSRQTEPRVETKKVAPKSRKSRADIFK